MSKNLADPEEVPTPIPTQEVDLEEVEDE